MRGVDGPDSTGVSTDAQAHAHAFLGHGLPVGHLSHRHTPNDTLSRYCGKVPPMGLSSEGRSRVHA
jgi:hypothetical protein